MVLLFIIDEALGAALIGAVRRYETTKAMPFEKGIVLPATVTRIRYTVLEYKTLLP